MLECLMHRKNPSQGYPCWNDLNNARNKVSVNVEHAFYQRGGEEEKKSSAKIRGALKPSRKLARSKS